MKEHLENVAALLPEAATTVGRSARALIDDAGREAESLWKAHGEPFTAGIRYGPIIPQPYVFGKDMRMDGYLALCAFNCASHLHHSGLQPVTFGLAGLQSCLHLYPAGYRLLNVGLNARRVVEYRELYRLASAPLLHTSLPHLAGNMATLVREGGELERRVGPRTTLSLMATLTALSQGLYVAGCWAAAQLSSTGGAAYFHGYASGFSSTLFGMQALLGYLREAELGGEMPDEFPLTHGRYHCWLGLAATHFFVPGASLASHVSGIGAGLIHAFALRAWTAFRGRASARRGWRRGGLGGDYRAAAWGGGRPLRLGRFRTRWWIDLVGHLALGGGLVLLLRRRAGRGGP